MNNENIITIPNIITLSRILLLPFFIFALVHNETKIAILLFAVIAISDALDGLFARITKQKTNFRAFFDTTADCVVILSILITFLVIKKYISLNLIIFLIIPTVISYVAKNIYSKKKNETSPIIIGKITVALAYITVIVLLMDLAYKNIFIAVIVLLAYTTMITYIAKIVKLYIK